MLRSLCGAARRSTDRGQHGDDIHRALQNERHAQQPAKQVHTCAGAEDEQAAARRRDDRRRHQKRPLADAERTRIRRDLHLKKPVREDQDADHRAEEIQRPVRVQQQARAQHQHQNAGGQVVFKRQPEQVLGKISDELHQPKREHCQPAQHPERPHGRAGVADHKHTEQAQQPGHDQIPDFCRFHRHCRTHGISPFFTYSIAPAPIFGNGHLRARVTNCHTRADLSKNVTDALPLTIAPHGVSL